MIVREILSLVRPAAELGDWFSPIETDSRLFSDALICIAAAANEAMDLPDGLRLLSNGLPVVFRQDVFAQYLGECRSEDGAKFDAIVFMIANQADVVVWLEDDLQRFRVEYRGAPEAVKRLGMEAKLFQGRCFTTSRTPVSSDA